MWYCIHHSVIKELIAISKHLFATALHAFIIMSPEAQLYTLGFGHVTGRGAYNFSGLTTLVSSNESFFNRELVDMYGGMQEHTV